MIHWSQKENAMSDEPSVQGSEDPAKKEKSPGEEHASDSAEQNLREPFPFARLFLTIAFGVVASFAFWIIAMLALLQFATIAIAGQRNGELMHFSRLMSRYVQEVFDYMTLSVDSRPFPLGPFPKE
jgi:hypothetical protein